MKGKILLVFPPIGTEMGGAVHIKGAAVPPLGPLYLAAQLLDAGYEVQFKDFGAEKYNKADLQELVRDKDIIGLSMLADLMFYYDYADSTLKYYSGGSATISEVERRSSTNMIIDHIREVSPTIPIMVGGPDVSLRPRVPKKADVAVMGEADLSIVQIADTIINDGDLSKCPGVLFRDRKTGEIKQGKPYTAPTNLDAISFPARRIVDHSQYSLLGKGLAGKVASMITSRGCPYRCTYCAVRSTEQHRYRERSPTNVLAEIEEICASGYEFLCIADSNFLVSKKRVHAIMDGILKRNIRLRILVEGRADLVDEDLMRKMRKAGIRGLIFGFESGCQDVLDFYRKRNTVEQNRNVIWLAHKYGVYTRGNFMLGAPIETREHIKTTIDFAMQNPLDMVRFRNLFYIYGTPLWNQARKDGLVRPEELSVLSTKERKLSNFKQRELEDICSNANIGFYKRPSYWIRQIRKAIKVGSHDPYLAFVMIRVSLGMFTGLMRAEFLKSMAVLRRHSRRM